MRTRQTLTAVCILALLLGASGCKLRKQKPPVPPPQATAPTITHFPDTSDPGPPPPVTVEPSRPLPTPGEAAAVASVEKPAPKPKPHVAKKTVPPPPAEQPKKSVVQNSGAPNQQGQLTASVTHDEALHQRLDTTQLINSAETTIRGITRQLNNDEQAMVQHIRSFIKQSQTATNEGDTQRAYNLAFKARQLADELAKR